MKDELKVLLANDFEAFAYKCCAAITGRPLEDLPFMSTVCDRLGKFAEGKTKRLIINMPPRHYKTLLGNITMCAWIIGKNPKAQVLSTTYNQDFAATTGAATRNIATRTWYREVFPNTRLERKTPTDLWTSKGGHIHFASIDGSITGRGAEFIIADDLLAIKEAQNPAKVERLISLCETELFTRLNRPSHDGILFIAHRLGKDDVAGALLEQGGWEQLKLPLIAPRDQQYEMSDGRIWHRKKGDLLIPGHFSGDEIKKLRAQTSFPDFETLWQQNPEGELGFTITPEHLTGFDNQTLCDRSPTVLSIDTGQVDGTSGSYSVIQAWAIVRDHYFLVNQWRQRTAYSDLKKTTRRMIAKHRPSHVLIEAAGWGHALASEIRDRPNVVVCPIRPAGNKSTRLRRNLPIIRAGRVHVCDRDAWYREFALELTTFPHATSDDQVDALSQFLDFMKSKPRLPSPAPRINVAGYGGAFGDLSRYNDPRARLTPIGNFGVLAQGRCHFRG